MLTKEKVSQKENVLITRITLRVISGYVTLKLHYHKKKTYFC